MATIVTTVTTLDIKFHVDDGTVVGDSVLWKFDNPYNVTSLQQVREAFGVGSQTYTDGLIAMSGNGASAGGIDGFKIVDKKGHPIDNIDEATITEITTTKTGLS